MTTSAAYHDLAELELRARALRAEAVRSMFAAGAARLRAIFAPRPAVRAA